MVGGAGSIFDGVSPLSNSTALLLFQMIFIILTCSILGKLLGLVRQPRVVAEVLGGILLGPTALGQIPGYMETIFPTESLGHLKTLAEMGLIFFLFIVGLEMDFQLMTKNVRQSTTIALVSTAVPFATGWLVAWVLTLILPDEIPSSYGTFGLFVAVCFCITAFPVLARILSAFHLTGASIGVTALSAAAISDVIAWGLLALVVALAGAGSPITALYVVICNGVFAVFMFLAVRPALTKLFIHRGYDEISQEVDEKPKPLSYMVTSIIFVIVLAASWATQVLGVDAIFGAFITGLIIPRMQTVPVQLMEVTEPLVSIVLLPLYFAFSGLKTDLTLLNTGMIWGMTVLVVIAVTICKVLPVMALYRWFGGSWGDSIALGFLMNTKGLVELIVLNIGLQANIISPTIFGILVLMSLVTTFITSPIVSALCHPNRQPSTAGSPDEDDISATTNHATNVSKLHASLIKAELSIAVHVENKHDTKRFSRLLGMLMVLVKDILHKTTVSETIIDPVNVGRFQVRKSVGAANAPKLVSDLPNQSNAQENQVDSDTQNKTTGDTPITHTSQRGPQITTLKLCAIHVVSTDDTYAGITYATSYFPNTRAVTDFQELCNQFSVSSYPFVALNHDTERNGCDQIVAEVATLQQGVDTLLLTWDRNAAIHDADGFTKCVQLKRKVDVLSPVMRTCVYIDSAPRSASSHLSRDNYGRGREATDTAAELQMFVPFLGGADAIEACVLAIQISNAAQGVYAQVHIVDYTQWLKPPTKKENGKGLSESVRAMADSSSVASIIEIDGANMNDVYEQSLRADTFLEFMSTYTQTTSTVKLSSPTQAEELLIHDRTKRVGPGYTGADRLATCSQHFGSLIAAQNATDTRAGTESVLVVCGARLPPVATADMKVVVPEEACVEGQLAAQLYETGYNLPLLSVRACDTRGETRLRNSEDIC
ncbi:hypothetical protein SARC_09911 [Sphaeroforma arctica JP610]|uniref:Cation/H+ exchanger transmembrane domain-containing protein n=1 Tax=Sphaeroforma arctica JP610 TaxID=667725 RepID=A0A0L0FLK4_9EUKA|nr:hypothetical protein SARC_09911 [Sphaeroforma arctica JP610]KNC77630.1 hypothetical protein SARC_09911 [Sphaeroforma arctica JP610]|eukprot:XP_014151532.1 hypothetical protein SARC_09911 [Sphaeroforma arctica JP610]